MHINGCKVTLIAPDGRTAIETAAIPTTAQPDGRIIYSNTSTGFWIETLADPDRTNHVVDFGWPDGKRGYEVTNVVPFVIPT